jgi:purine-binding chemotaxis protein CheW
MNIAELRKKAVKKPAAKSPEPQAAVVSPEPPPVAQQSSVEAQRAPLRETLPEPAWTPALDVAARELISSPATTPQRNRLDQLFMGNAQQDSNAEAWSLASAWGQEKEAVEEYRQMLSFALGNEEYALDIHDIREIIKPRDITDIPRVPDFILGIISLRGIVIPVFDLKRRFKLGTSILSPSSRIIICQRDNKAAGLLVDSISQVIKVPHASIEPPPLVLCGLERELLDGVGRHQEKMLILLNMPCVLNTDLT